MLARRLAVAPVFEIQRPVSGLRILPLGHGPVVLRAVCLVRGRRERVADLERDRVADLDRDRVADLDRDRVADLDRERVADFERERERARLDADLDRRVRDPDLDRERERSCFFMSRFIALKVACAAGDFKNVRTCSDVHCLTGFDRDRDRDHDFDRVADLELDRDRERDRVGVRDRERERARADLRSAPAPAPVARTQRFTPFEAVRIIHI